MTAVEAKQKEDAFQIESQYTCAAVNTSKNVGMSIFFGYTLYHEQNPGYI